MTEGKPRPRIFEGSVLVALPREWLLDRPEADLLRRSSCTLFVVLSFCGLLGVIKISEGALGAFKTSLSGVGGGNGGSGLSTRIGTGGCVLPLLKEVIGDGTRFRDEDLGAGLTRSPSDLLKGKLLSSGSDGGSGAVKGSLPLVVPEKIRVVNACGYK